MDAEDDLGFSDLPSLERAVEEIIREVGRQLARQHDNDAVEQVMRSIAERFRGARITAFLPILIKKEASERLKSLL